MDLELHRIDYHSVGPTLANSMKLLPNNYKQQQKVVVGDQDGIVQIFSIKDDEPQILFKTLPAEKVQCVQLGGVAGTVTDKIFVASENKVRAFNKKGKMFLTFNSNLTEPIKSMFVDANDLLLCGNHVYNHYKDCKDVGSYLCGDTIVDVAALRLNNTSRLITALACSGRVLRLLEHCRVRQSIELQSVPTVLHVSHANEDRLICGMADGKVVEFRIEQSTMNFTSKILVQSQEGSSAITAINTFDLTGDGKAELIVGRRDGTVQVYNIPTDENLFDVETREIFSETFTESISNIQGGCIGTNGCTEIVACTYTGRIFGLSTQCAKLDISDNTKSAYPFFVELNGRIAKLREEIQSLHVKVQKERDRYKFSTQSMSLGLSAIPMLPVNASMTLSPDAYYSLTIEISVPIEFVLLQCDVPIKLIDVKKSSAVMSFSKCDIANGNHLLATYRCQSDKNRVDLKFRTKEGAYGTFQMFITPNVQPKVSQMQSFIIKPLSLHMRVHSFDESRPLNQLHVKGSFSHAEIHNWLNNCIPEVPDKLQTTQGGKSVLFFRNTFIGTELMCEYHKGDACFKTDNISTLSTLKDFFTKEATKRRIKLEISCVAEPHSVAHITKQIEPFVLRHNQIQREYTSLARILDLDIQCDEDMSSLENDNALLLKRKNEITDLYEGSPDFLNHLIDLIIALYVDYHKIKGTNVKLRINDLVNSIRLYEYRAIAAFIVKENM